MWCCGVVVLKCTVERNDLCEEDECWKGGEEKGLVRMNGCAEMGDMFSRFCFAVIGFVLKFFWK